MNFEQWIQVVGPILGALMANLFELRKLRHMLERVVAVNDERHARTMTRIEDHEARIIDLEALEQIK